ncbi:MAG: hypothetical protein II671_06185, partial [Salinivirgaceae bacterium]|nr:hypothetical protein [Salinivirgaceae bacterium]
QNYTNIGNGNELKKYFLLFIFRFPDAQLFRKKKLQLFIIVYVCGLQLKSRLKTIFLRYE